ncbi:MAG: hypothetical protein ACK4K7_08560 [Allosphingosinicella sp.]|uniref:hypothetical protein n=1 Tax=Allosphingosinicella sp. TaxID=2823234 RepID=UPI003954ACFC
MGTTGPHAQPSHVIAEAGQVLLDGPEGVAVAFTPEAARETAERMLRAAEEAGEQVRTN